MQADNSLGRRILVIAIGPLADALAAAFPAERAEPRGDIRIVELSALAQGNAAYDAIRRDQLDQVIVVAPAAHDVVDAEALCTRCVQEGVKVGAILIGALTTSSEQNMTAGAARRYAETIAFVHEPETVVEILAALGA